VIENEEKSDGVPWPIHEMSNAATPPSERCQSCWRGVRASGQGDDTWCEGGGSEGDDA
jgi:hypothetical protein